MVLPVAPALFLEHSYHAYRPHFPGIWLGHGTDSSPPHWPASRHRFSKSPCPISIPFGMLLMRSSDRTKPTVNGRAGYTKKKIINKNKRERGEKRRISIDWPELPEQGG